VSDADPSGDPLDVHTLETLGRRAVTHPLVDRWAFRPDDLSPRRLELTLDADRFPASVEAARLDIRWFEGGDYTFHYPELGSEDVWQCRWDRHPKPGAPKEHFHPPPDASAVVKPSDVESSHHLGVLFFVLDWIDDRLEQWHGGPR